MSKRGEKASNPQHAHPTELTWVFHLVMVEECQSLQGITLGFPFQQARGAPFTYEDVNSEDIVGPPGRMCTGLAGWLVRVAKKGERCCFPTHTPFKSSRLFPGPSESMLQPALVLLPQQTLF